MVHSLKFQSSVFWFRDDEGPINYFVESFKSHAEIDISKEHIDYNLNIVQ